MPFLEYLKSNVGWLKDATTILFTGTATVVTILTYIRAKATILQPKRTEVTKKQTEILSDFLTVIAENNNSIDSALDYVSILRYNVDLVLREYGLLEISKDSEQYREYQDNIAGYIQFLENDLHDYIYAKGDFDGYERTIFEANDQARPKYYHLQAQLGQVKVHRIFYTKRHEEFFGKLRNFWNNPFLPTPIKDVAQRIGTGVYTNLHSDLRTILQTLVEKSTAAIQAGEPDSEVLSAKFRQQNLFRVFEQVRVHHDEDYELLKQQIRKHLLIEEKW